MSPFHAGAHIREPAGQIHGKNRVREALGDIEKMLDAIPQLLLRELQLFLRPFPFADVAKKEALRMSKASLDLALQSAEMGAWHWDIKDDKRSEKPLDNFFTHD